MVEDIKPPTPPSEPPPPSDTTPPPPPPPPPPPTPPSAPSKGGGGLEPNLAGLLCYVAGWITGLVFLLMEKENKFVRFHAFQSIFLSVTFFVVWLVLFIIGIIISAIPSATAQCAGGTIQTIICLAIWVVYIVFTILAMVKAYGNEEYHIPVIGNIVDKYK